MDTHFCVYLLATHVIYNLRARPATNYTDYFPLMTSRFGVPLLLADCIALNKQSWNRATLPAEQGGIVLRSASDLAISLFLASVFRQLAHQRAAVRQRAGPIFRDRCCTLGRTNGPRTSYQHNTKLNLG